MLSAVRFTIVMKLARDRQDYSLSRGDHSDVFAFLTGQYYFFDKYTQPYLPNSLYTEATGFMTNRNDRLVPASFDILSRVIFFSVYASMLYARYTADEIW